MRALHQPIAITLGEVVASIYQLAALVAFREKDLPPHSTQTISEVRPPTTSHPLNVSSDHFSSSNCTPVSVSEHDVGSHQELRPWRRCRDCRRLSSIHLRSTSQPRLCLSEKVSSGITTQFNVKLDADKPFYLAVHVHQDFDWGKANALRVTLDADEQDRVQNSQFIIVAPNNRVLTSIDDYMAYQPPSGDYSRPEGFYPNQGLHRFDQNGQDLTAYIDKFEIRSDAIKDGYLQYAYLKTNYLLDSKTAAKSVREGDHCKEHTNVFKKVQVRGKILVKVERIRLKKPDRRRDYASSCEAWGPREKPELSSKVLEQGGIFTEVAIDECDYVEMGEQIPYTVKQLTEAGDLANFVFHYYTPTQYEYLMILDNSFRGGASDSHAGQAAASMNTDDQDEADSEEELAQPIDLSVATTVDNEAGAENATQFAATYEVDPEANLDPDAVALPYKKLFQEVYDYHHDEEMFEKCKEDSKARDELRAIRNNAFKVSKPRTLSKPSKTKAVLKKKLEDPHGSLIDGLTNEARLGDLL